MMYSNYENRQPIKIGGHFKPETIISDADSIFSALLPWQTSLVFCLITPTYNFPPCCSSLKHTVHFIQIVNLDKYGLMLQ